MFSRNRTEHDGLQVYCKSCMKAANAATLASNPERVRALDAAKAKRWRDAHPVAAKEANARYRDANPDVVKAWKTAWIEANRDRYLSTRRNNSRKRYAEAPELAKARYQKWRANNIDQAREDDRAKSLRWAKAHPGKVNEITSRRRASVRAAAPKWREKDLIAVVYAKARALGMHVDHIVPLKSDLVSGLHIWHNLQLLAPALNISKHNKTWPDMPLNTES
jgi:hypothetical protein